MSDNEDALADHVASLPPTKQVDVLLGMLEKVSDERDRLRAELDTANAELEDAHRFERDARQVEAERDRLRAVVEIANRVVDRRDPEQWSVDHNAFAELGAALEQLDAGPAGEDT